MEIDDINTVLDRTDKNLDRIIARQLAGEAAQRLEKDGREKGRLTLLGLTLDEAEAWLENEPDLSSDDSYHGKNPIRSYQNLEMVRVKSSGLKNRACFGRRGLFWAFFLSGNGVGRRSFGVCHGTLGLWAAAGFGHLGSKLCRVAGLEKTENQRKMIRLGSTPLVLGSSDRAV